MVETTYCCPVCSLSIRDKQPFRSHALQEHHVSMDGDLKQHMRFSHVLLVPGYGHVEINAVRALFKLGWAPLLEDVAKLLGFVSPKSLLYCRRASNHHKSWELLKVIWYYRTEIFT